MAEEGDSGERTEQPTSKRLSEARKEGQVGLSADFSNVIGMIAAFLALQWVAPRLWLDLLIIIRNSFTSRYFSQPLTPQDLEQQALGVIRLLLPEMAVLVLIAAFFGAGTTLLQTNFLWSSKLLRPKMMHINPFNGLKRIFSINNAVQLLKSILKLAIIGPIAYGAFFSFLPQFVGLINDQVGHLLPFAAEVAGKVFWKIISYLLILAILDLFYQKWSTQRKLKMSKQEIKDEQKAVEGDESTRRRILSIGLRRARERMLQSVKTADVVVTNPTHIAVALSYSKDLGTAPRVIAKGKGHLAERIKELARQAGVPIVERKTLARALFKMAEVGQEIPYELYRSVAEILAYVYRLRGKVPLKAKSAMRQKQDADKTN